MHFYPLTLNQLKPSSTSLPKQNKNKKTSRNTLQVSYSILIRLLSIYPYPFPNTHTHASQPSKATLQMKPCTRSSVPSLEDELDDLLTSLISITNNYEDELRSHSTPSPQPVIQEIPSTSTLPNPTSLEVLISIDHDDFLNHRMSDQVWKQALEEMLRYLDSHLHLCPSTSQAWFDIHLLDHQQPSTDSLSSIYRSFHSQSPTHSVIDDWTDEQILNSFNQAMNIWVNMRSWIPLPFHRLSHSLLKISLLLLLLLVSWISRKGIAFFFIGSGSMVSLSFFRSQSRTNLKHPLTFFYLGVVW